MTSSVAGRSFATSPRIQSSLSMPVSFPSMRIRRIPISEGGIPPQIVQYFPSLSMVTGHPRIMVRDILNRVTAERAWGVFAGKMIVSPSFIGWVSPATQTSHSPSRIVTTAS